MSKAFDKVWHKGLLYRLKSNGIVSNLFNLMESYLLGRKKKRVQITGLETEWVDINSGVPQGSVLCLFSLFDIYISMTLKL